MMDYSKLPTSELEDMYGKFMDKLVDCGKEQEDGILAEMDFIEEELDKRDRCSCD